MKVLVPIKRVIDPYAKVGPSPDGAGLNTEGIKFEINPFDEIAVEEAVQLRERLKTQVAESVEVIVVTIGLASAEDQLRKALAMGADRAILIETNDSYDPPSVADELHQLVLEIEPDLVLMGKQATDDDANQVGQMLASLLAWPQATFASKVDIDDRTALVTRETDNGTECLELTLPAVITADLRLNEPRYIALPGIIKARGKPLERRSPQRPARLRTRVMRVWAPPAREPGKKVPDVESLANILVDRGAISRG